MKKIISILATITLMGTLVTGCSNEQKEAVEKMGLNLSKGEAFNIETKADINSTISANGQEMKMPMSMEVGTTLEVKSVDGEDINLDYTFDREKVKMNMMGQSVELDTEADTPEGKQMKEMLKQLKMSILVGKSGEIKNFELPEGLDANEELKNLIETQKVDISSMISFIPNDVELKVGSEWEKEQKQEASSMTVSYKEKFKITKIENDKIYVDSVMESSGVVNEAGSAEIKGTGTYVIAKNSLPESFGYKLNMISKGADLGNGINAEVNMDMNYSAIITKK